MEPSTSPTATEHTHLEQLIADGSIDARLIRPGVATPTVPDAAAALGVEPGQIVKSLLFAAKSGDVVLTVLSGDSRADRKRIAAEIGARDVSLAAPEVVLATTGYAAGGTPPVGHVTPVPVLVDERVLDWVTVFGGGGHHDALLEITPAEIVRVTGAKVVSIAR